MLTMITQSAALLNAIKEYENNKWKTIGQKVGKPAKVRTHFSPRHAFMPSYCRALSPSPPLSFSWEARETSSSRRYPYPSGDRADCIVHRRASNMPKNTSPISLARQRPPDEMLATSERLLGSK